MHKTWLSHAQTNLPLKNENGKMRLIITEKPQLFDALAPRAAERWPGEEIIMICSMPYILNVYSYPRGLAYNDYPLLGEPAYKKTESRFDDGSFTRAVLVTEGKAGDCYRMSFEQARKEMLRADHLVFAGDWDHAGVWGMERMLELLAPERDGSLFEVAIINAGLDERSLRRILSDLRTPADPRYQALKNAALVKRYSDYNFNVNSLSILGNLYRSAADSNQPVLITKNMVQILIEAAKVGEILENGRSKDNSLCHWKGTGKYDPRDCDAYEWWLSGMGSAASRPALLKQMTSLGMLEAKDDGKYPNGFAITQFGRDFASRLHKDCTDPDLTFRLCHWMAKPLEEIKPSIDAYLMGFFRKQKRLQDADGKKK